MVCATYQSSLNRIRLPNAAAIVIGCADDANFTYRDGQPVASTAKRLDYRTWVSFFFLQGNDNLDFRYCEPQSGQETTNIARLRFAGCLMRAVGHQLYTPRSLSEPIARGASVGRECWQIVLDNVPGDVETELVVAVP